jgi:hypothetical protein
MIRWKILSPLGLIRLIYNLNLKHCTFHVFVIQYLLTTNKIHLPGKCGYVLLYITSFQTCFSFNKTITFKGNEASLHHTCVFHTEVYTSVVIGCFSSLEIVIFVVMLYIQCVSRLEDITAGGDFLGPCDQKSWYKHVSNFGRLRSYDRLKHRREGNNYWQ